MKIRLLIALLSLSAGSFSQVFIEKAPVGAAAVGEYNFYGTSTLNKSIPYNRIKGTPFLADDWQLASLYNDNHRFSILPVRLNLATQEIHFLLAEREYVATTDNGINGIVFHKNGDTSLVAARFVKEVPGTYNKEQPLTGFLQVMNNGPYQLLKYTDRAVGVADSLFGTQKRYFFKDYTKYFVRARDMTRPVKKLDAESFLSLLPTASAYKDWIKEQKLSFKKEEDLLKFLAYYNDRLADAPR